MKVYGDIKKIEASIEKHYAEELRPLKQEADKRIAEIKNENSERLNLLKAEKKSRAEADAKLAYARLVNEQKLKAKRIFEETREALVNGVFCEVMKQAAKKAHTKHYLAYVKSFIPKTSEKLIATGDSDYYKALFKDIKVDKSITGVKFEAGNVIYNLTFDAMLSSKKEQIRDIVIRALFGEAR